MILNPVIFVLRKEMMTNILALDSLGRTLIYPVNNNKLASLEATLVETLPSD